MKKLEVMIILTDESDSQVYNL